MNGEEGPPRLADDAEAAQVIGRHAKQDLLDGIHGQEGSVRGGESGHDAPVWRGEQLQRRHPADY